VAERIVEGFSKDRNGKWNNPEKKIAGREERT